jgi:hypothetical protein
MRQNMGRLIHGEVDCENMELGQRLWAALKDSGPWPMEIIGKLEEEHKDDLSWIYLLDSHVHTVRIKSTCYFPQRKIDPPLEALADWVCS